MAYYLQQNLLNWWCQNDSFKIITVECKHQGQTKESWKGWIEMVKNRETTREKRGRRIANEEKVEWWNTINTENLIFDLPIGLRLKHWKHKMSGKRQRGKSKCCASLTNSK